MNIFEIDNTDFGIGEVICNIDGGVIKELVIAANEEIVESISDNENGKWSWIPYDPPMVFFREVPFRPENSEIEINEDLLDEHDISFYWTEHFNVFGTLAITGSHITVEGEIRYHMSDEKLYSLKIVVER